MELELFCVVVDTVVDEVVVEMVVVEIVVVEIVVVDTVVVEIVVVEIVVVEVVVVVVVVVVVGGGIQVLCVRVRTVNYIVTVTNLKGAVGSARSQTRPVAQIPK